MSSFISLLSCLIIILIFGINLPCGFLSAFSKGLQLDIELCGHALNTIAHRGPDSSSSVVLNNGRVFLGHNRLSIIDITNGNQPFMIVLADIS